VLSRVDEALSAGRSGRHVAFAPRYEQGDVELIRDIVAMANSGGGVIVIEADGINTNGDLRDLVAGYVGERFDDIDVEPRTYDQHAMTAIVVGPRVGSPLVFEKDSPAFAAGTVYVRHGSKSGPARTRDLERYARAESTRLRRELLKNVRKVSRAPQGAEVIVVAPSAAPDVAVERFRVVDDVDAPAVARTDFDVTHPYRQKELISALNAREGAAVVGPYEILCARRVHGIDDRPEFFHRPKFGSPQYSEAVVRWLLDEYHRDPQFFEKAKRAYRAPHG